MARGNLSGKKVDRSIGRPTKQSRSSAVVRAQASGILHRVLVGGVGLLVVLWAVEAAPSVKNRSGMRK